MKLVKSLLLGSVAGMAAIAGAQAADLPFRKAAPVDYVRVCDWTGAGYFYIPGSDTCLQIGGMVRGEYSFIEPTKSFIPSNTGTPGFPVGTYVPGRSHAASGLFARGRVYIDTRTQTAYGLLRTHAVFSMDRLNGIYSNSGNGNGTSGAGSASNAYIDKAWISFAGFQAGRLQSQFDFYADNYNFEGIANSDESAEQFNYTASFGGGFSAILSVEDKSARTTRIGNIDGGGVGYGGERIPDIVGVLDYAPGWGEVKISGAYHEINTLNNSLSVDGTVTGNYAKKTDDGFAVQAGVMVKLPMLAAGDDVWLQGAYQEGAYLYQDSAGNVNSGFNGSFLGGFQHLDADAVAIRDASANGGYSLHKGSGFSVAAAFHHYFTPQFHDVLFGSYEEIGYGSAVKNIDWTRGGIGDASEFRVGNDFIFTPVHNLDIGVEVIYARLDQTLAHAPGTNPTQLPLGVAKNPDAFEARLRMERDF